MRKAASKRAACTNLRGPNVWYCLMNQRSPRGNQGILPNHFMSGHSPQEHSPIFVAAPAARMGEGGAGVTEAL